MFSPTNRELKLVQFNVENLFLFLDLYSGQDLKKVTEAEWRSFSSSVTPNKPIAKTWALARCIEDLDADIVMLNEVGGEESLLNFNKHFLGSAYDVYLKEGNSTRGIDVGYLVRKNIGFNILHLSHRNRPIQFLYPHESSTPSGGKSHYFSRDVSELRLFEKNQTSPTLTILLTHLKSKLDPNNVDPMGRLRRSAELKTLVHIYNEIKSELGTDSAIVVAGDFNGVVSGDVKEPEFNPIHSETDLIEALTVAQVQDVHRYTQVQIDSLNKQHFIQIDYVFLSPKAAGMVAPNGVGVYRFKDHLGQPIPPPASMEARSYLASDHYPIFVTLKI